MVLSPLSHHGTCHEIRVRLVRQPAGVLVEPGQRKADVLCCITLSVSVMSLASAGLAHFGVSGVVCDN
eukprot:2989055-Pyramimonas_sp.AAC.1